MKRIALTVSVLFLLGACKQLGTLEEKVGLSDGAPKVEDTCGLAHAKRFRDVPASPDVLADIAARVGEKNLRVIRPGDAVTQDYRIDRLNVHIGAGGRIERWNCG